jgi:hypothetical protein
VIGGKGLDVEGRCIWLLGVIIVFGSEGLCSRLPHHRLLGLERKLRGL